MSPPSQLTPGTSVPDAECWSRALTNSDHVTAGGTVHLQALKGNAFSACTLPNYSHELSGRLVSLGGDIARAAQERVDAARNNFLAAGKRVPSKIQFMGVGCATTAEMRAPMNPPAPSDVIYTPNIDDNAHSDFIVNAASPDVLDSVRAEVSRRLRLVRPQDITARIGNCGLISATTPPASPSAG
jgi:hypothetical protein